MKLLSFANLITIFGLKGYETCNEFLLTHWEWDFLDLLRRFWICNLWYDYERSNSVIFRNNLCCFGFFNFILSANALYFPCEYYCDHLGQDDSCELSQKCNLSIHDWCWDFVAENNLLNLCSRTSGARFSVVMYSNKRYQKHKKIYSLKLECLQQLNTATKPRHTVWKAVLFFFV